MIRIYITEDHEMYLEGLTLILGKEKDIEVTGNSKDGKSLEATLDSLKADILLLDVHLPDVDPEIMVGLIKYKRPDLKIIFLTLMRGTRFVHKLIKYDIQGY